MGRAGTADGIPGVKYVPGGKIFRRKTDTCDSGQETAKRTGIVIWEQLVGPCVRARACVCASVRAYIS
jgi:hypothetical protein